MGFLLGLVAKVGVAVAGMFGGIPGWVISAVMFLWAVTDIISLVLEFI